MVCVCVCVCVAVAVAVAVAVCVGMGVGVGVCMCVCVWVCVHERVCHLLQQKERILQKAKKTHKQRVEVSIDYEPLCPSLACTHACMHVCNMLVLVWPFCLHSCRR